MGVSSKFTQSEIDRMKRLRECGASLSEIADIFATNDKTVFYHVKGITPSRDGHEIQVMKESFEQWLPQFPWEDEGLPLPRWLVRYLRNRE